MFLASKRNSASWYFLVATVVGHPGLCGNVAAMAVRHALVAKVSAAYRAVVEKPVLFVGRGAAALALPCTHLESMSSEVPVLGAGGAGRRCRRR